MTIDSRGGNISEAVEKSQSKIQNCEALRAPRGNI
jgi:hypothetical protein